MLYIVATPIGNLEDISLRGKRILSDVDLILAEDTRRAGRLLSHFEIKNKLKSYNDYNKEKITPELVKYLKHNDAALVSDAGTPGISDPGFYLVRECIKEDIPVVPVPGPSAIITALCASGLPTDKFSFHGFLPKSKKKVTDFLEFVKNRDETIVVYESPYRVEKTLKTMSEVIPQHDVVVARELTKKFEEFIRGKPSEILEKIVLKGEFVILFHK